MQFPVHHTVKGEGDAGYPVQEPDIFHKMSKPIQMPLKFDGSTSWEAFSVQFEIVSQINGWTKEEKASFLATSLKGPATLVLSNLSSEGQRDFDVLVKALSNHFGAAHHSELAHAKF